MNELAEKEILLVEDNPADVDLFKLALAESNIEGTLRIAATGEKALTIIREETMDLIILDLHMPGKSGMDVLGELKAGIDSTVTPILIFSTSDNPADVREAYELGANAYLTKRMDFEETVKLVETLNEFWFNAAELPNEAESPDPQQLD